MLYIVIALIVSIALNSFLINKLRSRNKKNKQKEATFERKEKLNDAQTNFFKNKEKIKESTKEVTDEIKKSSNTADLANSLNKL